LSAEDGKLVATLSSKPAMPDVAILRQIGDFESAIDSKKSPSILWLFLLTIFENSLALFLVIFEDQNFSFLGNFTPLILSFLAFWAFLG